MCSRNIPAKPLCYHCSTLWQPLFEASPSVASDRQGGDRPQTPQVVGAGTLCRCCSVFSFTYIYRLFSLFPLFIIFTHPIHKECFCFRRRTQMCSSTTYRDIQISLSANSVRDCQQCTWRIRDCDSLSLIVNPKRYLLNGSTVSVFRSKPIMA